MIDHQIDSALDEFRNADAKSRADKLREVAELLAAEPDPDVRRQAEAYADTIAARFAERAEDARNFRELKRRVESTAAGGPAPAGIRVAAPARARSPDRREHIHLEIFGALLDYPELLEQEEGLVAAQWVEGDVAAAIAALRQVWRSGALQNTELLLAKLPPSINQSAAARLAAPRHERIDVARAELLDNVKKLKVLDLKRQESVVVDDLQRAADTGDFDRELELLAEHARRARERRGL